MMTEDEILSKDQGNRKLQSRGGHYPRILLQEPQHLKSTTHHQGPINHLPRCRNTYRHHLAGIKSLIIYRANRLFRASNTTLQHIGCPNRKVTEVVLGWMGTRIAMEHLRILLLL